ncbi:MAG: helix-hairpin-helix domain-containing protein, partial [Candidatus Woesearchaeota archaeon]
GKEVLFNKPNYYITIGKKGDIKQFQKYVKPIKCEIDVTYSNYNNLGKYHQKYLGYKLLKITKINNYSYETPIQVYNLGIEDNNNYFASRFLVHNCGRAGRPEYEAYGEALTIAKNEQDKSEIYERYVCGTPEQIYSKLAVEPVFRTYLLSLIAANITDTKKQIKDFFSKTFWAFQFKDLDKLDYFIEKMLALLEEYEHIKIYQQKDDFTPASELQGDARIKATLLGKRVSELYLDPFTADHIINCLKKSSSKEIETTQFSFIQMFCHTLEMLPPLRVKAKDHEFVQEKLVEKYSQLLEDEPTLYDLNYDDFLNSIKTALFFEEWIEEKDEDYLLEKYGVPPGEVHTKLNIADWLLYSAHELAKIMQFQELLKEISKLRFRIKYGVKEELLPLLKIKGIGRKRARKLHDNKIKTVKELNQTSVALLAKLIGQKTAEAVKEQLEKAPQPVPEGRRKGQLAVFKFKE